MTMEIIKENVKKQSLQSIFWVTSLNLQTFTWHSVVSFCNKMFKLSYRIGYGRRSDVPELCSVTTDDLRSVENFTNQSVIAFG